MSFSDVPAVFNCRIKYIPPQRYQRTYNIKLGQAEIITGYSLPT
jgi:hypothetical protein